MLIRPIREDDLGDFEELARSSVGGIRSLPPDRRLLREKIERSQFAFSRDIIRPKGESYLFVLEDTEKQQVVGCSGALSKTGGYEPLYFYHLKSERFRSTYVRVDHRMKVLDLEKVYNGPAEVGTLYLDAQYRKGGLGRLLSLSRFLFIATQRNRFEPEVAALMRGVLDEQGVPLFWKEVCAPFYKLDFAEADRLHYIDPRYIPDLVPKHPLYVSLLSAQVRRVLGKTHESTQPALNLLLEEGFTSENRLDIFDAGPWYTCPVDQLWTVRCSKKAVVEKIVKKEPAGKEQIVCNGRLNFRACLATLLATKGKVTLSDKTAHLLQVKKGETITYRPTHGGKR